MHFSPTSMLDDGLRLREFTLDDVPGLLWLPPRARPEAPVPLVLMGHPGGLGALRPRLHARARGAAGLGFAAAALELPGAGDRPGISEIDAARSALRAAIGPGERPPAELVDRLVLPLVDQALPECRAVLDALLALPEIRPPVGVSGGPTALGVRLALVEPRIVAAGLFAGSYLPGRTLEEARGVTVPVHVLLQWDDHANDREAALRLFDALGSAEKTLQANLGGHTGIPPHAAEDAGRFFARHLR